ncbi:MAG: hypothetical protein Q8L48_37085 [Archangium sp.]|nr:hypothetical protein [Archangium sp.]
MLPAICIDPLLSDSPTAASSPAARSDRKWLVGAGVLFALYGFIGAFALPFSTLGEPVVFVDGRFFVLGFGGLAIAAFGIQGGALRGRSKVVALVVAAALLAGICASTWGLIVLMERFGYFLRF